jgi:hypothetical protein
MPARRYVIFYKSKSYVFYIKEDALVGEFKQTFSKTLRHLNTVEINPTEIIFTDGNNIQVIENLNFNIPSKKLQTQQNFDDISNLQLLF